MATTFVFFRQVFLRFGAGVGGSDREPGVGGSHRERGGDVISSLGEFHDQPDNVKKIILLINND
jgi:hypothetical protein